MQLKDKINNSIKLRPLSSSKSLVAIFGVIGSRTTPKNISENCESLGQRRG
jgi:hypothetical protein